MDDSPFFPDPSKGVEKDNTQMQSCQQYVQQIEHANGAEDKGNFFL
jgi:hypothetical protein